MTVIVQNLQANAFNIIFLIASSLLKVGLVGSEKFSEEHEHCNESNKLETRASIDGTGT
jgi:hypothetical protein